jgi:two-component system sensor histidine kinase TctE
VITKSLRAQLLAWLLVPLGAFALVEFSVAYRTAERTAQVVTDRILLASARSIAERVTVAESGAEAFVPPSAIGMFDLGYSDSVYYRITRGGRLLAGSPDLPMAAAPPRPTVPAFYDGVYRGTPVHVVEIVQPVPARGKAEDVSVIVAETLRGRSAMSRELWTASAIEQFLLVALAFALAWLVLRRVLGPLLQLGHAVRDRKPDDFRAFSVPALQAELDPLVEALNGYQRRLQGQLEAQRRFTANAAHQLRTPLTLLRTQASYALRADGADDRTEATRAILATSKQLTRLTNQLLSLARAEPHGQLERREDVDLVATARAVLEDFGSLAVERGVDLAFDVGTGASAIFRADPAMVRDLIVNLVDNAVRYTPSGGSVVVKVECEPDACRLIVEDDGPGIPRELRDFAFERFARLSSRDSEGSGLGLPIVREIAGAHGARVTLGDRPQGTGLVVEVLFPRGVRAGATSAPGGTRPSEPAPVETS